MNRKTPPYLRGKKKHDRNDGSRSYSRRSPISDGTDKDPEKLPDKRGKKFIKNKSFKERDYKSQNQRNNQGIQPGKPNDENSGLGSNVNSKRDTNPYRKPGNSNVNYEFRRFNDQSANTQHTGRSRWDKVDYKPHWKKKSDFDKKLTLKRNDAPDKTIRLNKFISNSGICSRRDADLLITSGAITVNGEVVTTLGTKINHADKVIYDGRQLIPERKVYVLLNKPKDFVTTLDDPQGRKTVMDLLRGVGNVRLYPVGRLDRNTTGLLLLTNDGELAKKLTHPSHRVKKLYQVQLDKPFAKNDMHLVSLGIDLDGEKVIPDTVSYIGNGEDKKQIGIEIHSGQNRVIRRLFETLDYKVEKLDRVMFAGLTKKDIPRGHWRYLTQKEIGYIKML